MVADTLDRGGTGLPVFLLEHADRTLAIVAFHTLGVVLAGEQALDAVRIAHVGLTVNGPAVNAQARTVAIVVGLLELPGAGLLHAYCVGIPVPARSGPVAFPVQGARVFRCLLAFVLRVGAGCRILARSGPVASSAEPALTVRITVVGVVLTDAFGAGLAAGPAGPATVRFATHAFQAEAADALVARTARLAVVLLQLARRVPGAPVAGRTMLVNGTGRVAVLGGLVAHVRMAVHAAPVKAGPQAVTLIGIVRGPVGATLDRTLSARNPFPARGRTVACTILAACALQRLVALVFGIGSFTSVDTASRSVAHDAHAAVALRISAGRVGSAGTGNGRAGHTVALTSGLAAVAVNTETGLALVGPCTGLAVLLLFLALRRTAVVAIDAMLVLEAGLQAEDAARIALVRRTVLRTTVNAGSVPIAEVGQVRHGIGTILGLADGVGYPQPARTCAVTRPVPATFGNRFRGAVPLGILAVSDLRAGSGAVANLADEALVVRVFIHSEQRAGSFRTHQPARFADAVASGGTAIAVHAVLTGALRITGTGLPIVLRHGTIVVRVTVIAVYAIIVIHAERLAIRARIVALIRRAVRFGPGRTVAQPIAPGSCLLDMTHAGS